MLTVRHWSVDTSYYGLGVVLLLKEDGKWKPVMFISKGLTEAVREMPKLKRRHW